jgi:hypothetical protein
VFGTDCYTDALRAVRTECRNLDHDGKTRLALAFANCHLYKLGKRTYTCSAGMPLKACVNHKDPEFYFAHMQFLQRDRQVQLPFCLCCLCLQWVLLSSHAMFAQALVHACTQTVQYGD